MSPFSLFFEPKGMFLYSKPSEEQIKDEAERQARLDKILYDAMVAGRERQLEDADKAARRSVQERTRGVFGPKQARWK